MNWRVPAGRPNLLIIMIRSRSESPVVSSSGGRRTECLSRIYRSDDTTTRCVCGAGRKGCLSSTSSKTVQRGHSSFISVQSGLSFRTTRIDSQAGCFLFLSFSFLFPCLSLSSPSLGRFHSFCVPIGHLDPPTRSCQSVRGSA